MEQTKQTDDCKCVGAKEVKALRKQVSELSCEIADLRKELAIIRKAVRK